MRSMVFLSLIVVLALTTIACPPDDDDDNDDDSTPVDDDSGDNDDDDNDDATPDDDDDTTPDDDSGDDDSADDDDDTAVNEPVFELIGSGEARSLDIAPDGTRHILTHNGCYLHLYVVDDQNIVQDRQYIGYQCGEVHGALDDQGGYHLVALDDSADELVYMTNESGEWETTIIGSYFIYLVDDGSASLAVDADRHVHVAFHESLAGLLMYASNQTGAWVVEVADDMEGAGLYNALALDSTGGVHISYYCNGLKYASNRTGVWNNEIIGMTQDEEEGFRGRYTSIALDENDAVHIAFQSRITGPFAREKLEYVTNKSGVWTGEVVLGDEENDYGRLTSIRPDSSGDIHITSVSYRSPFVDWLWYSKKSGGVWTSEPVPTGHGNHIWKPRLALNNQEKPVIAFHDIMEGHYRLSLAVQEETGTWSFSDIDPVVSPHRHVEMAWGSNGDIHFVYHEGATHAVQYGFHENNRYVHETVKSLDPTAAIESSPSLVLDSADFAHISFYDYENQDVAYATNRSGSWVVTTIPGPNNEGSLNDIAVGPNGESHICFRDDDRRWLMYATNAGGAWTVTPLRRDNPYTVEIETDANGAVHAAYYLAGLKSVYYSTNRSGSWEHQRLDNYFLTADGWRMGFQLDPQGFAHIVYARMDNSTYSIYYATNKSGRWEKTHILDTHSSSSLRQFSLALGPGAIPHVLLNHQEEPNEPTNLYYGTNLSGTWTWTTLIELDAYRFAEGNCMVYGGGNLHMLYGPPSLWHAVVPPGWEGTR